MMNYCIAGTQRSGSNFVCNTLKLTGQLGEPREYFNPVHVGEDIKDVHAKDTREYCRIVSERYRQRGVFSQKIHYLQFFDHFLEQKVDFMESFPGLRMILLRRADKVAQAVSLAKAYQSNQWTAEMEAWKEPEYDFNKIRECYFDMIIHEKAWLKYFKAQHVPYLDIVYENMMKDMDGFFLQIFAYLGRLDLYEQYEPSAMKKQSDSKSEEWFGRFREELTADASQEANAGQWRARCQRWKVNFPYDSVENDIQGGVAC